MPKRILIADDHESMLRGVRIMLEAHADWSVCGEAVNGYEAITKAVELRPDLIVLDFAMPDLDGLQAADEIRKLLGQVPLPANEVYLEKDPERMFGVMRQTRKTCFAFKILAAGRLAGSADSLDGAFKTAFAGNPMKLWAMANLMIVVSQ